MLSGVRKSPRPKRRLSGSASDLDVPANVGVSAGIMTVGSADDSGGRVFARPLKALLAEQCIYGHTVRATPEKHLFRDVANTPSSLCVTYPDSAAQSVLYRTDLPAIVQKLFEFLRAKGFSPFSFHFLSIFALPSYIVQNSTVVKKHQITIRTRSLCKKIPLIFLDI